MFEDRRARRAERQYRSELQIWQSEHDELSAVLALARSGRGIDSPSLMLKSGEELVARIMGVGLIEMRRGPGQWKGRSSGVSVPVGLGIRVRVGSSRGHYVQGTPQPQAIDTGELNVTNQRLVFLGANKTVECQLAKMLSLEIEDGQIRAAVSNRQKTTVVGYGAALDDWLRVRTSLALALFNGEADAFAQTIQRHLTALEAQRPAAPPPPPEVQPVKEHRQRSARPSVSQARRPVWLRSLLWFGAWFAALVVAGQTLPGGSNAPAYSSAIVALLFASGPCAAIFISGRALVRRLLARRTGSSEGLVVAED